HRGRGRDGVPRPRGDRLEGGRGPALLPDEPRPVRGRGDRDDRERLHRADHPRTADGVRGRAEPFGGAADGGLRRMTTFDRAALDALPIAPGSTGAIRERACAQFEALPVPSQETEEWRYTDLSDFSLDFVPHAPGHGDGDPPTDSDGLAASILQHNSSVGMTTSGQDLESRGVIFCDLDLAAEKYP